MASDVVIRAEGLGKKYIIGHQAQREGYVALRDVIARNVRNFGRTAMDVMRGRPTVAGDELEEFWALRELDFEIRRGDVVGVIGRNGAGKSTLLKVLSRITEPTEGRVEIRGRVASLLEVGTGFHPELTGRENIYLNGAILGMSHAEIRRKFDEIVDFAEVERFLDTPVKRYSSGMYVRLAFAVAAHLEPEILIVDEVLAVGDAEFQKKCLGKMGEVAGHGRTVLFVSHNTSAIATLCSRGILLKDGGVQYQGDATSALQAYSALRAHPTTRRSPREIRDGDGPKIEIVDAAAAATTTEAGAVLEIEIDLEVRRGGRAALEVVLKNGLQSPVLYYNRGTTNLNERLDLAEGAHHAKIRIPISRLAQDEYSIDIQVLDPGVVIYDRIEDLHSFSHVRFDTGMRFDRGWGNGNVEADLADAQFEIVKAT